METSWLIAVLLAAMASFISNLGVTLQKLHHLRLASDRSSSHSVDDYHRGWMWRVGLGLVFFGSLADFAALSFGPQSLVAPLGSLTLVSNVIFAPLLLKETIGHWDVLATTLIVVGSSLAVAFGSHESQQFTVWILFGYFTQWEFIIYASIMTFGIIVLYLLIQKIELIEKEDGVHSPRYLQYKGLHRFAYPALSGTVGAQSVLFAKAFVELLANTVRHWQGSVTPTPVTTTTSFNGTTDGISDLVPAQSHLSSENMFVHWQTYFIFAAMLGAIFAQIKYLNEGLKRFDASYAVPVFTSFWIILSVLSGMIFYQEYKGMNTMQGWLFVFGVLITVIGVITLSGREQTHPSSHHSVLVDEDDEESGVSHHGVTHEGSINPSEQNGGRSHRTSSNASSQQHTIRNDHEDNLELDLDLEDGLEDVGIHGSNPNSSSGVVGASAVPHVHHVTVLPHSSHHIPSHHHSHRIVAPSTSSEPEEHEGTVVDGAKTAALEAKDRISQAFNKLRGKSGLMDAESHAVASIQSAMNSSSSSKSLNLNLPRGGGHGDDSEHDAYASADDDSDPLILKGAAAKARKSKSPNQSTTTITTTSNSSNGQLPTIWQPTTSPPIDIAAGVPDIHSLEHYAVDPNGPQGISTRKTSLTPTAASLYTGEVLHPSQLMSTGAAAATRVGSETTLIGGGGSTPGGGLKRSDSSSSASGSTKAKDRSY